MPVQETVREEPDARAVGRPHGRSIAPVSFGESRRSAIHAEHPQVAREGDTVVGDRGVQAERDGPVRSDRDIGRRPYVQEIIDRRLPSVLLNRHAAFPSLIALPDGTPPMHGLPRGL